jgi:transposase
MASAAADGDFFLHPNSPRHRRYEILRAWFVERLPAQEIAERFGVSVHTVHTQVRDWKRARKQGEPMEFFVQKRPGPKCDRKKPRVREHIVRLRARGYADTDIHAALRKADMEVSVSLIDQVLREEGLIGLRKRTREERERVKAELASGQIPGLTVPPPAAPETPAVADVRELDVSEGRSLVQRQLFIADFRVRRCALKEG